MQLLQRRLHLSAASHVLRHDGTFTLQTASVDLGNATLPCVAFDIAPHVVWDINALDVGGVNSAEEQDSSIGGDAGYVCLGVVHMKEEVQDKEQVEVGKRRAR